MLFTQVTENTHRYLKETEVREEGGTPAIVESIRAGLVFQLKQVRHACTIGLLMHHGLLNTIYQTHE